MAMMRRFAPLLLLLALHLVPIQSDNDEFCIDYELENAVWPPCTQCIEETNDFFLGMGVPQTFNPSEIDEEEFSEGYNEAVEHLTAVAENSELRHILPLCKNKHELCTQWAIQGWCEEEFYYMYHDCCPACASSAQLEFELECPMDPNAPHAWRPGDLNEFFQNLKQYEPHVHSRPSLLPGDTTETASYKVGPWVVTLENVVSEEEANTLIKWGERYGWDDSLVAGDEEADGTSDAVLSDDRTSSLSWCYDECMEDPIVEGVLERLSAITNLHSNHSDYLQLLRYQEGQFYNMHHDFHNYQVYASTGARILTLYIYLRDVADGGATSFPDLDIEIQPKLGRALLWPNVLNENPDERDDRIYHEARPPRRGQLKYGATAWWHQRDFKTADEYGCAQ